ncbi:MAG: transporter [Chloroflexi bacterium]|nr:transporter [Chloroflexota bacterium]
MATQSLGAAPGAPFSMRSILGPLLTIIVGMFMVILDTTAVNVALPTFVKDFHSTLPSLQWVLTGYMLAQAAVIPLAGWLSDRFGAKRLFLIALTLFTIGSALCATAQNTNMLILFRVLQGLGGGFVMPIGMAYTYRLSPPEKRGVVMGTIGIPILFAPALGPTLAGWLVQYASWHWIFLINVPIGVLALFLGTRKLPFVNPQAAGELDLPGIVLGPLSFVLLSYGVSEGATSWTSANTLTGLIGGAIALVSFVLVELRSTKPLLELRVFRSIDFTLGVIVQWVCQIALLGGIFLVPLFLQQVRGYGPFDTGLVMIAQALTAAVFMPIGGRLFDKIGVRPLAIVGMTSVAVGTYLLSRLSGTTQGTDLIVPLMLRGAGMSLVMMPLSTHVLNAAPRNLVSRVTSLTAALQNVVGSLAIAGLATVVASRPSFHTATAQVQALTAKAQAAAAKTPGHKVPQNGFQMPTSIADLFASAFSDTLMIVMGISAVGILLSFTLRRNHAAQAAVAPTTVAEAPALEMAV